MKKNISKYYYNNLFYYNITGLVRYFMCIWLFDNCQFDKLNIILFQLLKDIHSKIIYLVD
jgi:hypothetical protein